MNKVLSLIIPSCNMEAYLAHNLDSLLIDSLDDIEILVINDGSRDRTSEIAHSYADRYPGSIRIIDKPNGHYGSCVNRGLKEATGKYVKILDADDSFDTPAFEEFVQFLKRTDADMVLSDYVEVDEDGTEIRKCNIPEISNGVATFDEALPVFMSVLLQMHSVTYRTAMLRNINYSQTEGCAYTDTEWTFKPVLSVQTVAQFPKVVYRYLIGRSGQSMDPSVVRKANPVLLRLFDGRVDYFHKMNPDGAHRQFAIHQLLWSIDYVYRGIILGKSDAEAESLLRHADTSVAQKAPELYVALSERPASHRLPIKYIRNWRNNSAMSKFANRLFCMILQLNHHTK